MRTWASNHGCIPGLLITNALSKNEISVRPHNDYIHIMEQSKANQSCIANKSINQEITYVGLPKPILSCMNQFCKFYNLELQNLILAYLKYFKNQRSCENFFARKKVAIQIY